MSILNTIRQFFDDRKQFGAGAVRIRKLGTKGRIYKYAVDLDSDDKIRGFYPFFKKRFMRNLVRTRFQAALKQVDLDRRRGEGAFMVGHHPGVDAAALGRGVAGPASTPPGSGTHTKVKPKIEVSAVHIKADGTRTDLGTIARSG